MGIEDNGPESAYPGPAEPGSEEETYPDADADNDVEQSEEGGTAENSQSDKLETPDNPPVDEAEEPSPGSSA